MKNGSDVLGKKCADCDVGSPVVSLTERKLYLDTIKAALLRAVSEHGGSVESLGHKRLRVFLPNMRRGLIVKINPNGPPTEEQQRAVEEVLARIERRRKNR